MLVIPAIDLKGGQYVRLKQGKFNQVTVFGNDPLAIAKKWEEEGAQWLHVVDLDGAFQKSPKNMQAIKQILRAVDIPVQVGGGIRNLDIVSKYLDMGVSRVILGTVALQNPDMFSEACNRFPGQVALGLDAKGGKVAIEGWTKVSAKSPLEIARTFSSFPLSAIIYTDIQRDGMQTGVNIQATKTLAESVSVPVIASGGVASIEDIQALLPLEACGVIGVITGRAIYDGSLSLRDAVEVAKIRE